MLRVISANITSLGQSFLDEVRDPQKIVQHPDNIRDPNDAPGVINESNYEDYLVDKVEKPENEHIEPITTAPPVTDQSDFLAEMPTTNEALGIPQDTPETQIANPLNLVYGGIDSDQVIGFEYTNRHGAYAGFRTVEPHYTFVARTTGNEVLVSFDRDVGDIRAFIVGNIHPNGVLYEGIRFAPRPEIMTGIV